MATAAQQQQQRQQLQKVKNLLDQTKFARAYFNALTDQYQYVHPALNVFHSEAKGRGIKANKDIPAGTILISNPSGTRVDLVDGMEHRHGNLSLGMSLFSRLGSYGFNLDSLSIPNDTLGYEGDLEQPEYISGDCIGTRGANASKEYPLSAVSPVLPEYMCPNLSQLPNYPNPFLYQDKDGQLQHIPLNVSPSLPVELRTNLIAAMQDRNRGYQLLMRCVLMAQENSVMTPYNIPFLLPHQIMKPKPITQEQANKAQKEAAKKAKATKSTAKVMAVKKTMAKNGVTPKGQQPAKVEKDEEEEPEQTSYRNTFNFFSQLQEDNKLGDDIPAALLRFCKQADDEDDVDEDEDEEQDDPQKGKSDEQDEDDSESVSAVDQLVLFPTFALLNHDCKPNTTPLFFHIPTNEFIAKVYKEHKEIIAKSDSPQSTTFNLPREASYASLAVVVALSDIKAGDELTINYTPLAHCETSPSLQNDSPVIQFIPWMQEFRQAQMKRIHSMKCACSSCKLDAIIHVASGAKTFVEIKEEKKVDEKKDEAQEIKPLTPLLEIAPEIYQDLSKFDSKDIASRLLLHTIVLSDQVSTFNRNAVPLMLFRNRTDGEENPDWIIRHPKQIIERLRALVTHPLWSAFFQVRGGWEKIGRDTPLLSVEEIFSSSQSLLAHVASALEAGRVNPSAVVKKENADTKNSTLQDAELMPIIIPQGFNAVNQVNKDGAVKTAIVSSEKATLVPTIGQLDSTTALATSIGIYAAISGGFERMRMYGLPDEPEEKEMTTIGEAAEITEDDLFDGVVTSAGSSAHEQKLEQQAKKKTAAIVNASDGTIVKNDSEKRKKMQEMRAYREMAHILEAILLEVMGINASEGRKEYVLPTHWFVSTCLGVLHPIYIQLGGNVEAMIAALFLTYITGISVPLSNVANVPLVTQQHTPTQMREAKKINDKWTYQQAVDPVPGSSVKPIHQTLMSLMIYLSDSLENLLPELNVGIQYCNYQLNRASQEGFVPEEGEDPIDKEQMKKDLDFVTQVHTAIWFLGSSLESYMF